MEKKILFLDYDGVLFDTLLEVYLVCRYQYKKISLFDEVNEAEYERFSKFKYLCYNIWMFYYYNPLIFGNVKDDELAELFFEKIQNRNLIKEQTFCEEFLNIRTNLVREHYDYWKSLEKPFKFFNFIKELYEQKNADIAIVSKKNKTSITDRFKTNNFNFNSDMIFAREFLANYSTKGEFLNEFFEKYNYDSGIFVDDNSNNLKTNINPKIKNILALWGNNDPNDKNGYSQDEAIEEIKKLF